MLEILWVERESGVVIGQGGPVEKCTWSTVPNDEKETEYCLIVRIDRKAR